MMAEVGDGAPLDDFSKPIRHVVGSRSSKTRLGKSFFLTCP
jgi:hypothetical protein